MQFNLVLKNDRSKNFRLISQLLVVFNLIGFTILLISNEKKITDNLWLIASVIITFLYTIFSLVEWISKKSFPDFWHRSVFAACAAAWLYAGFWWFSVLLIIFIILDYQVHRKLIVKISDKKIQLPALVDKNIDWNELNNVILKDGILTIDFKNNKLFQHLIVNADDDVNENHFNTFCNGQLNK